ncbi:hypothetical protein [Nocardioides coralli]|uniref:hypothetical protein n=1 Tax=Nocardioides coralli TaxID=2872154 RepID=UPI001CA3E0AA|nr:hypothetical protein [Nocardioides coralli]QZY29277.1 hypothetical protein K6T13_00710 [Nocardioides coralli]
MARTTPRRRAEPARPWSRRREQQPGARRQVGVDGRAGSASAPVTPPPDRSPQRGTQRAEAPPPPAPALRAEPVEETADTALLVPPSTAPEPAVVPARSRVVLRLLAALWLLITLLGTGLLVVGLFDVLPRTEVDLAAGLVLDLDAPWVPQLGAVAVATTYVWALAARTGGRPAVFGLLTLGVAVAVLVLDNGLLRNGAAVMTCVVAAVLAVVATVPAVGLRHTVREVVVATLIAAVGGLATVGLAPDVDPLRFQYTTLGLALLGAFGLIYRLGAGLHGLGRRGVVIVVFGAVVLALTLAYAELLRRYGTPVLVEWLFDGVDRVRALIGASPRPIVALLGVPALVWGTHMRARRRQGWWVCAFGVGATVPVAQALLDPEPSRAAAALGLGYGVVVGLVLGAVLVLVDLALTGNRGRRGRRAESSSAVRPEPSRVEALL